MPSVVYFLSFSTHDRNKLGLAVYIMHTVNIKYGMHAEREIIIKIVCLAAVSNYNHRIVFNFIKQLQHNGAIYWLQSSAGPLRVRINTEILKQGD